MPRAGDRIASIRERIGHQDRVVALRAGGEQRHRRLDQLLDAADVFDRGGRQLGPGARALGGFRPAFDALVDRLGSGLRVRGRPAGSRSARRRCRSRCRSSAPSKPSSTSSLVSAMPSMPPTLTAWRTRAASNQPQRRLRPVTVPNSRPRSPRGWPISSMQLGRERAGADARGVGLGDAEHVADRAGADAGAGRRLPRHGVGRGDVRIGAVVDVEHGALRALEQDAVAALARVVEQLPDRLGVGQDLGRDLAQLARAAPRRRPPSAPRPRSSALWCSSSASILRSSASGSARSQTRMARRADLVLVGRADAAAGGADLAGAARFLAQQVELAVQRQDQRGVLGERQDLGRDRHALRRAGSRSPSAAPRDRPPRRCR